MPTDQPGSNNQVGKVLLEPFLHFYRPPTQDVHVLKEINETCYEPLFRMLLDNPDFKCTFNINTILLDCSRITGWITPSALLQELVVRADRDRGIGKFAPSFH